MTWRFCAIHQLSSSAGFADEGTTVMSERTREQEGPRNHRRSDCQDLLEGLILSLCALVVVAVSRQKRVGCTLDGVYHTCHHREALSASRIELSNPTRFECKRDFDKRRREQAHILLCSWSKSGFICRAETIIVVLPATTNEQADVVTGSHPFEAGPEVANPDEVLILKVAIVKFDRDSPVEVDRLH